MQAGQLALLELEILLLQLAMFHCFYLLEALKLLVQYFL